MHIDHKQNLLILEQQVTYTKPLFDPAHIPRDPPSIL
jgi:hypothetical protein